MRTSKLFTLAATTLAALCLGSCSQEIEELSTPVAKRQVAFSVTLPSSNADTRTTIEADGEGLKVNWSAGDKLSAYTDADSPVTFTLKGEGGSSTATFEGEIPESWSDGDAVTMQYPEKNGDILIDWSAQTGDIADLSEMDWIKINATYTDGALTVGEVKHGAAFLHLNGLTVSSAASGTATLTLSNVINSVKTDGEVAGEIEVSAAVSDGKLADVYIAFLPDGDNTPRLNVTTGSETRVFILDREGGFEAGNVYNISDTYKPTEMAVGKVMGADGKFYNNVKAATNAGTTAVAMVVYVGEVDGVCENGLAISLENADENNPYTYSWANAQTRLSAWASSHPVEGGTWRIPTADDYKYMFEGCGGDKYTSNLTDKMKVNPGNLRSLLKKAGADDMNSGDYWTSTPDGNKRWVYTFANSYDYFYTSSTGVLTTNYVRPILAF